MSIPKRVEIERLRYWQGQRLLARDFRDQATIEAQLRWWHNRALHNAFGVRYGLAILPLTAQGSLCALRVDCGVAYDCFGRELMLQTAREIPLPPVGVKPQNITLLIRYKETAAFPKKHEVSNACAPGGGVALLEQPEFVWKQSDLVQVTDGVPLTQLNYDGSKGSFLFLPDFVAPSLRPLARPRIGSGATVPEGTAWELWSERVSVANRRVREVSVGYQVTIDTSAAGFTERPCYFAWLQGTLWSQSNIEFFPVPFTHLDSESITQFRFRLWMPRIPTLLGARLRLSNVQFENEFINFARRRRLYVCWIGIQPSLAETAGRRCVAVEESECHTVNKD